MKRRSIGCFYGNIVCVKRFEIFMHVTIPNFLGIDPNDSPIIQINFYHNCKDTSKAVPREEYYVAMLI